MGLDEVEDLALHKILTLLGPNGTAALACVNKRLRVSASDETLWSRFCGAELHLSTPLDPQGNHTSSFRVAYGLWREAFGMYNWDLVKRVKACWQTLKVWLNFNFPEVADTLQQGASEADIQELEDELHVKLPVTTRILYRICNGQDLSDVTSSCQLWGLIGGYSFYEHLVNVFLLPLKNVIAETLDTPPSGQSEYILVAISLFSQKFFFLNCNDGQLYVGTEKLSEGEMLPCVPNALIRSVHDMKSDQPQDALLLWLEEHGRRLISGDIKLREKEGVKSIDLFPKVAPLRSSCITNGVKVRASAVFVPEYSALPMGFYAYSICISLLPDGCFVNGMQYESCQLQGRHWIIRNNDAVSKDFYGEAVIGKYPLLFPGKKEFVYESCTPLPSCTGSIEGSFTFVPGRLTNPKGSPFEARVEMFPLQLPDYIF